MVSKHENIPFAWRDQDRIWTGGRVGQARNRDAVHEIGEAHSDAVSVKIP